MRNARGFSPKPRPNHHLNEQNISHVTHTGTHGISFRIRGDNALKIIKVIVIQRDDILRRSDFFSEKGLIVPIIHWLQI